MSSKSNEENINFDSLIKYILIEYDEKNVQNALKMIKDFIKTQEILNDNDFKKRFIAIFQEELKESEQEVLSLTSDIVRTFDIRTTPSSLRDVTMDFLYLSLNNLEEKAILGAFAGTFIRCLKKGMKHKDFLEYRKEQSKLMDKVLEENPEKYTKDPEAFFEEVTKTEQKKNPAKSSQKSPSKSDKISILEVEKMRNARLRKFDKEKVEKKESYDSTYKVKFNKKTYSIPYSSTNNDTKKLENIIKKLIKLLIKERNIENETSVEILYQKHSNYITFIQGGKKFKVSENKDMIVDVSKLPTPMILFTDILAGKLTRKKLKKPRKRNTKILKNITKK